MSIGEVTKETLAHAKSELNNYNNVVVKSAVVNEPSKAVFYNCDIKVSGPGRTFNDVMIIIRRALQEAGYVVDVDDEYPVKTEMEDIELERLKKLKNKQYPIKLTANHRPWGG